MQGRYSHISTAFVLIAGVIVGWSLSLLRPAPLHAGAGDRSGETIVATGPVLVKYDKAAESPSSLDALYFLDYKGGGCWRRSRPSGNRLRPPRLIESFIERDLVADFKLDLDAGPRPRFLMTTGSLGPYTAGWAPLYVVETTTSQVAVYRMQVQETIGKSSRPKFELVQLRSYAKTGRNLAFEPVRMQRSRAFSRFAPRRPDELDSLGHGRSRRGPADPALPARLAAAAACPVGRRPRRPFLAQDRRLAVGPVLLVQRSATRPWDRTPSPAPLDRTCDTGSR